MIHPKNAASLFLELCQVTVLGSKHFEGVSAAGAPAQYDLDWNFSRGSCRAKGSENSLQSRSSLRLRGGGYLDGMHALRDLVEEKGAHALPGCNIKYDTFIPVLRRACSRGYVKDRHAEFVEQGLLKGFTLGVDTQMLKGRRVFRNTSKAYQARESLTDSIESRLNKGRTIHLGPWAYVHAELCECYDDFICFGMSAVPKPHQPEVMRATSDHTKTGLNAATVVGILKYSLNTYEEVAWLLRKDAFMYVSDVEDAFMLIPLAPAIWLFMIFRWFKSRDPKEHPADHHAYTHIFGDFGTRGLPGTFKIFLVDVVVQMARSEMVLTLPLRVYVDDAALIGAEGGGDEQEVNAEMQRFQVWSADVTGVAWKALKDRMAAIPQLYIGFWWDSRDFTRCLEEQKLLRYLDDLAAAADSSCLTLQARQSLSGKMQRAILTFPPGAACLLVNCYALMSGLTLPWHRRRTTRAERMDFKFVHDLLQLNLGKGYYSYAGFPIGPEYRSDASKSRGYTGGGWVGADGFYDFFRYGTSAARKPIDYLEGDVVVRACRSRGAAWRGLQIPFGIDNMAFQKSSAKGRSKAPRLNSLLRELFVLQIEHNFILCPYWLSTHENTLADDLSRNRAGKFLRDVRGSGFLTSPSVHLQQADDAGRTVAVSASLEPGMHALRQLLDSYSSNVSKDGPPAARGLSAQTMSVAYPPTSIWDGLPFDVEGRVEEIMDNHLAPSSREKMMVGYRRWAAYCEARAWPTLLKTGDSSRGGKLAAWVTSMVDETELVYASISTYVWGVRAWMVLQHQADPILGCMFWREFMLGVAVLTAVPGEPRQRFPFEDLEAILRALDDKKLVDCNLALILLVLIFTFSRTECPCPKTWSGRHDFDERKHWTVGDFKLLRGPDGHWVLWVRFKMIKQDTRMERPSASQQPEWLPFDPPSDGLGRDWVPIGDVDDPLFSVARWYMAFVRAVGRERGPGESFFLSEDATRPYTYACLMSDLHRMQGLLGLARGTPHGLRVEGYNRSKAGNGLELTVAHGGWSKESSGHARYERFSFARACSVPAGVLGVASFFNVDGERDVSLSRARRGQPSAAGAACDVAVDDLSEVDVGEVQDEGVAGAGAAAVRGGRAEVLPLLPEGYSVERRRYRSGNTYKVYIAPDGREFRSRLAVFRALEQDGGDSSSEADRVALSSRSASPSLDMLRSSVEEVLGAAARGAGRGTRPDRAQGRARRLGVEVESFEATQCGNPRCVVPSKNGRHAGDHIFPDPGRRRR